MNEFSVKIQSEGERTKVGEQVRRAAESAAAAGSNVRNAASNLVKQSAEAVQDQASEIVGTAKGMASDGGHRLQQKFNEQKGTGAEYVSRLADSINRAADQFEGEFPIAGSYMRTAASQVENAAVALRSGNIDDLVKGAQAFARRQPTLFLGVAFLAGFGAVRFLRSSSPVAASDGANAAKSVSP
jgi:hypothetical protein